MTMLIDTSNFTDKEDEYRDQLHAEKYRDKDQTFSAHANAMADNMSTNTVHASRLRPILQHQRFLPAGRVQAAMGANQREVSAFNCSVSSTIHDNIDSIMTAAHQAAKILRLGTGIGYNFSHLRPKGALIKSLQTEASGPVSFMRIFEATASTIASSGHRRGAQMAVLNIGHPDIEEFIQAKMQKDVFRHFNLSVGVTDKFMRCLEKGDKYPLSFNNKIYKWVDPKWLWDLIMRNAYASAEPGVIFIERMNAENNLYYCEEIEATNPCSEQPLPENGLCLLGSFNLPAYVTKERKIDYKLLGDDIRDIVEAYDNVFEKSVYAIPEHEEEAKSKRRMGLGYTGIASALEYVTESHYGSAAFNAEFKSLAKYLVNSAYSASIDLAKTRGVFREYDRDLYTTAKFISRLPDHIIANIKKHGIRNSHLISYAPCGTISQVAGNVSSGVEPVFFHKMDRNVNMKSGKVSITLTDYNVKTYGYYGKTLDDCTVDDHISVLAIAQKYCDSSVSKTINVPESCTYEEYQDIYIRAYNNGAKGITVFRPTELRGAVITSAAPKTIKPETTVHKKEFIYGGSGSCVDGVCTV